MLSSINEKLSHFLGFTSGYHFLNSNSQIHQNNYQGETSLEEQNINENSISPGNFVSRLKSQEPNYKTLFILTLGALIASIFLGPLAGVLFDRYILFGTSSISSSSQSYFRSSLLKNLPRWIPINYDIAIAKNWGSLSPYFADGGATSSIPSAELGGVETLPNKCSYKQVHVLHRHAERYPTEGTWENLRAFAKKIKDWRTKSISSGKSSKYDTLSWLDDWEFTLGYDLLVSRGVGTEFKSGSDFWASHGSLLFKARENGKLFYRPELNVYPDGSERPLPVIRATTQSRIKTSARAWAAGFFGAYSGEEDNFPSSVKGDKDLYTLVLQAEEPHTNNTLAAEYSCPMVAQDDAWHKPDSKKWQSEYLNSAANRIGSSFPGLNFTYKDAYHFQQMCAYEVAAYGTSRFCGWFTLKEWLGFEYVNDLQFWGYASFGSKYGPALGSGWVAELLARLENRTIDVSEYGVNSTITSNPDTFPTDQLFYMDMSHDTQLISVLTALGLNIFAEELPTDHFSNDRDFIVSLLTPFGARLYVELLSCDSEPSHTHNNNNNNNNNSNNTNNKHNNKNNNNDDNNDNTIDDNKSVKSEVFVRLKLNDRVLPLFDLADCPDTKDNLCPLNDFVSSLHKALDKINFDEICYSNLP